MIEEGDFWYSSMVIVAWSRVALSRLWQCLQSLKTNSPHSEHQNIDDLHATVEVAIFSSINGIKQLCDKHPEKYQTYCKEHQNLYCRKCAITSHNNCKDKFPLEEVVDREKNPSFVQKMEQFLDVLTKNIKTIIASEKDNLDMLNETKEEIEKKIKQTRLAINRYLDKLEKQLLTKLQKESDREKRKIMKSEATLAKKGKKIRECQDILQNIQTNQ
jgi:vacuolar-type H+-ATPase subunit H